MRGGGGKLKGDETGEALGIMYSRGNGRQDEWGGRVDGKEGEGRETER